jgi:xanthine dehydrogenase YagS FAD-binding subunit
VAAACPTLAEAAGAAASPALRNRATLGGNLGQHTRCGYYRMTSFACFKRGDALCPPRLAGGVQETAGIFDNGSCACAHPSSLAPVLGAAGATALVAGPKGEGSGGVRRVPMTALYAPPVQGKASDLALDPSEVITAVELPPRTAGTRDGYYEVRQKAAFDWALVVAAVRLDAADGKIRAASVWLGAVAPYPWRATAAEQAAVGASLTPAAFAAIADAAVVGAQPLPGNQYKLDLVRVSVRRALAAAAGRT